MSKPPTQARLLTIKHTADHCAVSTKSVRRWIEAKDLPAVKLGSAWRIRPEDLERFLRDRLAR